MSKHIVTIKDIPGQGVLEYNEGLLKSFQNEFEGMTPEQIRYFLKNSAVHADLSKMEASLKTVKVKTLVEDLTFEQFYEAYGYKKDRQSAEKAWGRLSKAEQHRAFDYIKTYESDLIRVKRAKLYPSTYLNKKPWND